MNKNLEFQYLCAFAMQYGLCEENTRNQLRCLWTAYCIHFDLEVDTAEYDNDLLKLWNVASNFGEDTNGWSNFDSFDNFMCENMV